MSEALVKVDAQEMAMERPSPRAVIKAATEEANVLAEVIESRKLFSMIQGRKYVKVEGWTTLATLRGCLPREVAVHEMPEGRYVAEVELVRMSDGMVLTRASAECGGDGDNIWRNRPANARRSMAITRATGKAARVAFSWVMALAGYEPTPLEEMDHVGGQQSEDNAGPAPRANEATSRQWPARGVPPPDKTPDEQALPIWRGKIMDVEQKTGTTSKGPWRLYLFKGHDGEEFGTFSETDAAALTKLKDGYIEIVWERTKKGAKNIIEYRDITKDEVPL